MHRRRARGRRRSSTRRSSCRRSTRGARSRSSSTRASCRRTSSTRSSATGSRARRPRSTSRSTGCRSYPALAGRDDHFRGFTNIGPSIDYLERAYDEAKYGWYSIAAVPRLRDPEHDRPRHGAARQARDVVLRPVGAVPAPRERLGHRAQEPRRHRPARRSSRSSRASAKLVLQREVVTPLDIEQTAGLSEGNIFARRVARPADVLLPAGAGLERLPDADRRLLPVRLRARTPAAA